MAGWSGWGKQASGWAVCFFVVFAIIYVFEEYKKTGPMPVKRLVVLPLWNLCLKRMEDEAEGGGGVTSQNGDSPMFVVYPL